MTRQDAKQTFSSPRARLLSLYKIEQIERYLANCIGVVAKNQNGIAVAISGKQEDVVQLDFNVPGYKDIMVVGLCSTSGNVPLIETRLRLIYSGFSKIWDPRDVDVKILRDFLCSYIKKIIYDTDNQEVVATSFALIQVENTPRQSLTSSRTLSLGAILIDHVGNYGYMNPASSYHIFVCTDNEKRIRAASILEPMKIELMTVIQLKDIVGFATMEALGNKIAFETFAWEFESS